MLGYRHVLTTAHCLKEYANNTIQASNNVIKIEYHNSISDRYQVFDLVVRLGEWGVNREKHLFPFVGMSVVRVSIHPEYYARSAGVHPSGILRQKLGQ